MLFRGVSPINVDAKGRMAVPAKYRERLQALCEGRLVVTVDFSGCLMLFPETAWDELERKLTRMSDTDSKIRSLKRLLMGHASDVELDSHGRILLPVMLREFAGLDKRIVLVGQGNKFEIWDEATWYGSRDAWLAEVNSAAGELPDELASLSF